VPEPVLDELARRARRRRQRRRRRRRRLVVGAVGPLSCCALASGAVPGGDRDAAPVPPWPAPARVEVAPATPCPVPASLRTAFARASSLAGLEPALLAAVARAESALQPDAVSHRGARGLLQLMPATAEELGVDPDLPAENLAGGARYLRALIDRFGSLQLALAAYEAGPRTVERFGGVPPYAETEWYVGRVAGLRRELSGCRF
jgi:soluble lytic murein transglycosylase-like protein